MTWNKKEEKNIQYGGGGYVLPGIRIPNFNMYVNEKVHFIAAEV